MYSTIKTNRSKQNKTNKKLWVLMLQVNMLKIGKKKKNNISNMTAMYSFVGMTE